MNYSDDLDTICDFPSGEMDSCAAAKTRRRELRALNYVDGSECPTPRPMNSGTEEWQHVPKPYSRAKMYLIVVPLTLLTIFIVWYIKKKHDQYRKPSLPPSSMTKTGTLTKKCDNCQRGASAPASSDAPSSSTSTDSQQPQTIEPVPTPWGKIPAGSRGIVQRIYSEKCAACKSGKAAWDEWKEELLKSNYHVEEIEVDMTNPRNPGTYYALKCNFMAVPAIRHLPSGEAAMGPAPLESLRKWIERIEREYDE